MNRDTLARVDGILYVVGEFNETREPMIRRFYWPVLRTSGWIPCWFDPDSSGEYCRTCGQRKISPLHTLTPETLNLGGRDGVYGGLLSNGARYTVEIDPRGKAVKIEEIPIPAPKVRAGIETRYHNGEWQKCLKATGWVSA